MGWNALRSHGNPLTPQVIIPVFGEFELPERGVNTHKYLALLEVLPQSMFYNDLGWMT